MLQRDEADILAGASILRYDRYRVIDFTTPFTDSVAGKEEMNIYLHILYLHVWIRNGDFLNPQRLHQSVEPFRMLESKLNQTLERGCSGRKKSLNQHLIISIYTYRSTQKKLWIINSSGNIVLTFERYADSVARSICGQYVADCDETVRVEHVGDGCCQRRCFWPSFKSVRSGFTIGRRDPVYSTRRYLGVLFGFRATR